MSEFSVSFDRRVELSSKLTDYRRIMEAATRRRSEAPPRVFKEAHDSVSQKALFAWSTAQEAEWKKESVRAAHLILDALLRGEVDLETLRQTVEPESLGDVLLRTGEDYTVLLLIGEGRREHEAAIVERGRQMAEAKEWLSVFDGPLRFLADKRWAKIVEAEQGIAKFDAPRSWSKADMLLFRGARKNFATAIADFRQSYEDRLRAQEERKR